MRRERMREQRTFPVESSSVLFSGFPELLEFSPTEDPLASSVGQSVGRSAGHTPSQTHIEMDSPFPPSELYDSLEEDKEQGLILAYTLHSGPQPTDALTSLVPGSLMASAQVRLLEGRFVNVVLNCKGFYVESRSEKEAPVYYETLPNLLGSISPKYKQRWHSTLFSKLLELKASMKSQDDRRPEFLEEATI